jgi:hypothetical protein
MTVGTGTTSGINPAILEYTQGDTSYNSEGPTSVTGTPQQLEDNRIAAIFSANGNVQQNNANSLAFTQNDQQYGLQREAIDFERDKFGLNVGLQNRNIDLNYRTIDSQATITDAHSSALLGLQKQIDGLDSSDPQYQRKLSALTNSFTAISQAGSQANSNITTQTAQGHGSVQTAQSGVLGATSNTSGQQIDAGVAVAGISADTQLGLADRKVTLDTTLAETQAGVSIHHTDAVGAPVAQGQGNYFTGIGSGTAGFTNGADYNNNTNFSGTYNQGFGGVVTPFAGGFPPATQPAPALNPALSGGSVLSGQIKNFTGS